MEREKEYCIMGCGRWTGNYKDTHISLRKNYRETQGDLCDECAGDLDADDAKSSKEAKRREISQNYGIE